ncbi:DUF2891 family protein [Lacinutrix mariniflava]|uniref:DUF2891 family protein n=1 Tax=Lacinutrix mariniflava TaxID=342955 RepID=UPI0006E3C603|nr:DUF2891 family protein [Lacinutrix mariniflava]
MKKNLLALIFCLLQVITTYGQLKELKIYEKNDADKCEFSYVNSNNSICSTYNTNALLKYEAIDNVIFVIDFMGPLKDINVKFNRIKIDNNRIQFNGTSTNNEKTYCSFIVENGLISEGILQNEDQGYKIDIGFDKKTEDVKMWYYPYALKKTEMRFNSSSDYNDLNSFGALTDINTLLEIWAKEAHDDTFNTTTGVDLAAPIFHGSYDWHSSIHGHLATNYAGFFLNDYSTFIDDVNIQFTAPNVQGELNYASPYQWLEIQYGMPWLLNYNTYLDESIYNGVSNPLQPLAQNSYNLSYNHVLNNLNNFSVYNNSLDSGYFNFNWQLLNLYIYAEQNGLNSTSTYVINQLNNYADSVNWDTVGEGDFFDPKAIALLLYTKAGLTSGTAWNNLIQAYDSSSTDLPFTDLNLEPAHKAGLVISKSWGYWLMYHHTGEIRYKDAFIAHNDQVFQYLKIQQDNDPITYFTYLSHWVPNFGVFGFKLVEDYPENNTLTINNFGQNINSEIIIYPTAVDNILNINNYNTSNTELTIVDSKGSTVYNKTHDNGVEKINLAYLSSGVYVILIKNDNKEERARFIKI